MFEFYNVEDDVDSIKDISRILATVREEFSANATVESTLWSEQFERLKVINEGMVGQLNEF